MTLSISALTLQDLSLAELGTATQDLDELEMKTRYEELLFASVMLAQDERQSSLFEERVLSLGHKFVKVRDFHKHIHKLIAQADLHNYNIAISFFEVSSEIANQALDIFNQQAVVLVVLTSDKIDITNITTVHDFVNARDEEFNQIVEECFEIVDKFNLKRKILKTLNSTLKVTQVDEFKDFNDSNSIEFKL